MGYNFTKRKAGKVFITVKMENEDKSMVTIHISITPELKTLLEQYKTKTHKSYSGIIIDLAKEEVDRYEKEKGGGKI